MCASIGKFNLLMLMWLMHVKP